MQKYCLNDLQGQLATVEICKIHTLDQALSHTQQYVHGANKSFYKIILGNHLW